MSKNNQTTKPFWAIQSEFLDEVGRLYDKVLTLEEVAKVGANAVRVWQPMEDGGRWLGYAYLSLEGKIYYETECDAEGAPQLSATMKVQNVSLMEDEDGYSTLTADYVEEA